MSTSAKIKKRKKRRHGSRRLIIAALLIAITVPVTRHYLKAHHYIESLGPGEVLEAVPRYNPGLFKNTRVLLLSYSPGGATGVVLNEPLPAGLGRYPEPPSLTLPDVPSTSLHWGGPVALSQPYRVMLDSINEQRTVSFTMVDITTPLADGVSDRVYMGYTGWSAGQLEREIRQRGWRLVPSQQWPDSPLLHLLKKRIKHNESDNG